MKSKVKQENKNNNNNENNNDNMNAILNIHVNIDERGKRREGVASEVGEIIPQAHVQDLNNFSANI